MDPRQITDVNVEGKRVLCRVDFNVPLHDGVIVDDTRIRAALPTISWLRDHGARIILCSHLGRPKGKPVDELRLAPIAMRLSELLGVPVTALNEVTGPVAEDAVQAMRDGEVLLLENLRFDPREETDDVGLSKELANLADLYVNDAFGAAHRAHASTAGVATLLPAFAGQLMISEVKALEKLLTEPERPFVAIIGGAKVSDKLAVLENLAPKVDTLLIGGGMANTFLVARGYAVGQSLVEADLVDTSRHMMEQAIEVGRVIELPEDVIVAQSIDVPAGRVTTVSRIDSTEAIFDIGPESARKYADIIATARTVFWNGPLGVAENPAFAAGTATVAKAVASCRGYTVIGGGDSVAAIEQLGLADRIDHISTGGGASLEFLEGRELPGLAAIPEAE
jgi:phosphoglycerate kinase